MQKTTTSNTYAVVKKNGLVVGQIAGNGKTFTFSIPPQATNMTVCLDQDVNIATSSSYPNYDFCRV
jgi:hypothetical protein